MSLHVLNQVDDALLLVNTTAILVHSLEFGCLFRYKVIVDMGEHRLVCRRQGLHELLLIRCKLGQFSKSNRLNLTRVRIKRYA